MKRLRGRKIVEAPAPVLATMSLTMQEWMHALIRAFPDRMSQLEDGGWYRFEATFKPESQVMIIEAKEIPR